MRLRSLDEDEVSMQESIRRTGLRADLLLDANIGTCNYRFEHGSMDDTGMYYQRSHTVTIISTSCLQLLLIEGLLS